MPFMLSITGLEYSNCKEKIEQPSSISTARGRRFSKTDALSPCGVCGAPAVGGGELARHAAAGKLLAVQVY